jgi:hypothetical protein
VGRGARAGAGRQNNREKQSTECHSRPAGKLTSRIHLSVFGTTAICPVA